MHCVDIAMIWTWKTKILQWYDAQFTIIYNTEANLPSPVDRIMAPKDVRVLIPGPVNVTLHGKKILEKYDWVKDLEIILNFLDGLLNAISVAI